MKFSERWLREWVNPDLSSQALADQLTMAGLEIDAMTPVAADVSRIVVGRVQSIAPHPQADRLQICQVDVGHHDGPLQIVCGAKNVAVDMRVPTALLGASLPTGMEIKAAKLRGVKSFGMLCSAQELGLLEQANGLMPLDADAQPGQDIRDYLQLDDISLEIGLTPNRGDCLSLCGIAREIGALNRMSVRVPDETAVVPTCPDALDVVLNAGEHCPQYVGRIIKGINPAASTPIWMQERLRRSGLRSLGAVVDVTNYVMLELGQPMHAFDLARLNGAVKVCFGRAGSSLTLLDGRTIELDGDDTLIIADTDRPLALAGIMGGRHSAVSDETVDLFLEAAHFTPSAIAGKARVYGLHTDSSHRFERGVNPALPRQAIERASRLLLDIAGGKAGPLTDVSTGLETLKPAPITLRANRVGRLLGMTVSNPDIEDILSRLGLVLDTIEDGAWRVHVPSYRFDLAHEADLIEEIARIWGYDRLPDSRPLIHAGIPAIPADKEAKLPRLRQALVDRGYYEAISYSFIDQKLQQCFDPDQKPLVLANPLASDMSVMRTSLWPGLVTAARHNQCRQQSRIRLFELGHCFRKDADGTLNEDLVMAGLICGSVYPNQWAAESRPADFYDAKGDLDAVIPGLGFRGAEHPALHPGRTARLTGWDGSDIGWLGSLHPATLQACDLEGEVLLFELSLDFLTRQAGKAFRELSRFPFVRRDLAILVPESLEVQSIQDCVHRAAGALLVDFEIFDVYQGGSVDSGLKSVAIGLTLQEISRTLTDNEVDGCLSLVIDRLQTEHGVRLRDR